MVPITVKSGQLSGLPMRKKRLKLQKLNNILLCKLAFYMTILTTHFQMVERELLMHYSLTLARYVFQIGEAFLTSGPTM